MARQKLRKEGLHLSQLLACLVYLNDFNLVLDYNNIVWWAIISLTQITYHVHRVRDEKPTSVIWQWKAHYKTDNGFFIILISQKVHSETAYGIERYGKRKAATSYWTARICRQLLENINGICSNVIFWDIKKATKAYEKWQPWQVAIRIKQLWNPEESNAWKAGKRKTIKGKKSTEGS